MAGTAIDEFTRRSLAIVVRRRFTAHHVVEILAQLMIVNGVPEHIRPDQDKLIDQEIFYTLHEAEILIEDWRRHYMP